MRCRLTLFAAGLLWLAASANAAGVDAEYPGWSGDSLPEGPFGEAVALAFLQDQVWFYNEDVSIDIHKIDGGVQTIKNV